MGKKIFNRDIVWEDGNPNFYKLYASRFLDEDYDQAKKYVRRSALDRRSFLDRRIMNFTFKCPDKDRRLKKDRRKGWDDRVEQQSKTRLGSFPEGYMF